MKKILKSILIFLCLVFYTTVMGILIYQFITDEYYVPPAEAPETISKTSNMYTLKRNDLKHDSYIVVSPFL
ncbi:hypothetical protein BLD50_09115 [Bacillus cereus]|nr:hypothetical protein BLD50_09115 [Bacillus cereus]